MATFAVGDIHGNLSALNDLLGQLRSVAARDDTVVFLGDYIDRGPDSRGCVDAILRFREEVEAEVICLIGNHEDWLLRTMRDYSLHSWLFGMEAFETIRSYSEAAAGSLRAALKDLGLRLYLGGCPLPYEAFFQSMPADHLRFFEELREYHETADCVCSHAGVQPGAGHIRDHSREALIWGTGGFPDLYDGAEVIVYGHWNNAVLNADGWPGPRFVGRTVGIDSIRYGVLTAIRMPDLRVFQSSRYDEENSWRT